MKVLMFHSVGNEKSSWCQNWLSVSLVHFEHFCKFLKKNNYQTLFLKEWYELQNRPHLINNKQILLTFDDGYLDNWVYAYPILKKYDLKGTIFINPEFVDPLALVRPNIEEVWDGSISMNEIKSLGFLNWKEIKKMDKSDIINIQSHSMSHNYYFLSDKIIDYYKGQDVYHWLAWIEKPERKPYWLTENQKDFIPYGYPIFEYGRALGLKRYFPSDDFKDYFINIANENASNNNVNIKNALIVASIDYKQKYGSLGRYETYREMKSRYRYELFESKRILEEKLDKEIEFLCWPGGGYNDLCIILSEELGYKASTIASCEKHKNNDNSKYYKRIQRFGLSSFAYNKLTNKHSYCKNKNHLTHFFLSIQNHVFYRNLYRTKKIISIIKNKIV